MCNTATWGNFANESAASSRALRNSLTRGSQGPSCQPQPRQGPHTGRPRADPEVLGGGLHGGGRGAAKPAHTRALPGNSRGWLGALPEALPSPRGRRQHGRDERGGGGAGAAGGEGHHQRLQEEPAHVSRAPAVPPPPPPPGVVGGGRGRGQASSRPRTAGLDPRAAHKSRRSRVGARQLSAAAGPAFRYRKKLSGESLEVTSENQNVATLFGSPPSHPFPRSSRNSKDFTRVSTSHIRLRYTVWVCMCFVNTTLLRFIPDLGKKGLLVILFSMGQNPLSLLAEGSLRLLLTFASPVPKL